MLKQRSLILSLVFFCYKWLGKGVLAGVFCCWTFLNVFLHSQEWLGSGQEHTRGTSLSDLLASFCVLLHDFFSLYCNKELKLWGLPRWCSLSSFQSCNCHHFPLLLEQQEQTEMSTQQAQSSPVTNSQAGEQNLVGLLLQTKVKWKTKINGKGRRTSEVKKNQFGHLVGVANPCRKPCLIVKMNK